jgi:hypothetical protein
MIKEEILKNAGMTINEAYLPQGNRLKKMINSAKIKTIKQIEGSKEPPTQINSIFSSLLSLVSKIEDLEFAIKKKNKEEKTNKIKSNIPIIKKDFIKVSTNIIKNVAFFKEYSIMNFVISIVMNFIVIILSIEKELEGKTSTIYNLKKLLLVDKSSFLILGPFILALTKKDLADKDFKFKAIDILQSIQKALKKNTKK